MQAISTEGRMQAHPYHKLCLEGEHLNRIIELLNWKRPQRSLIQPLMKCTELINLFFFFRETHFHDLRFFPHILLPLAGTMPCCDTSTSGWLYPAMKCPLCGTGPKQKRLLKTWYPPFLLMSGTDISHQQTHCGEHHHRSLVVHLTPFTG